MTIKQAFSWNTSDQVINQLLQFLGNIVLMRFLLPDDFGLFAIPLLIFQFLRLVQDLGSTYLIIKDQNITKHDLSAILGYIIVITVVLFLIFSLLLVPAVSWFLGNEISGDLLFYLAFLIVPCIPLVFYDALFRKNLDFKSLFWINTIATILSFVAAFLAYQHVSGAGVLLIKTATFIGVSTVVTLLLAKQKYWPIFSLHYIKRTTSYSLPIAFDEIINFSVRNLDSILIGKFIGVSALGIYDRAYRFLTFPIQQVSANIGKVFFPLLATKCKEDQLAYFMQITKKITYVITPGMIFIAFFSKELVLVIFGENWVEVGPLLRVFSIVAIFQVHTPLLTQLFYLSDDTKSLMRFTALTKPFYILAFTLGAVVYKDILTTSYLYALVAILAQITFVLMCSKQFKFGFINYCVPLLKAFGASVAVVGLIYALIA